MFLITCNARTSHSPYAIPELAITRSIYKARRVALAFAAYKAHAPLNPKPIIVGIARRATRAPRISRRVAWSRVA